MGSYRFRWLRRHDDRIIDLYRQADPVLTLDRIAADIGVERSSVARRLKKLDIPERPYISRNGISPIGDSHRGCTVIGVVPSAKNRNRVAILRCENNRAHEFERFLFAVRQGTAGGCPMCRAAATSTRQEPARVAATLPSPRKRMFAAVKALNPRQNDTYRLYRRKGFSAPESLAAATAAHP